MHRILSFLLIASLLACTTTPSPPPPKVEVQKSADEDNLLMSLAGELIANPKTQAEKDQNILINYIMDQGIEVKRTPTGLFYQIIEEGQGTKAKWGDWVTVHYKGYTLDGKEFDSSYKRKAPIEFYIGNMIPGWNEGLEFLAPGGKALFLIPSALAYGEKGFPGFIGPNTVLAFEVALIKVEQK